VGRYCRQWLATTGILLVYALLMASSKPSGALTMPEQLPEGGGIAAEYPGDVAIEADPEVLFADSFEGFRDDAVATDATDQEGMKWDVAWHNVRITRDPANVHSGMQAVEVRHQEAPMSHGLGKVFERGIDTVFVRYYMKLDRDFPGCHHIGMNVWAGAPGVVMASGTDHSATGVRPNGENHFVVSLDAAQPSRRRREPAPGRSNIYCYHMDQVGRYGDLFFPSGEVRPRENEGLFGPTFVPRPEFTADLGRWHCYELMARANTPGQRDGRVAFWVDGILRGDFPNLRLRSVDALKINNVHLSTYSSRVRPHQNLWYDDVIVATSYIGPQAGGP
jgi:hypothetical protein